MVGTTLNISKETQRRFILGMQGLYPGRRWRGKTGVVEALHSGCVLQIDPINVVARNHDIALHGRVLDYQPTQLEEILYTDRAGFDYGGTVLIYPMEELPYCRVMMQRKVNEPRWKKFVEESGRIVDTVYQTIRERGPLSTRDFEGEYSRVRGFRAGKDSSVALYYLWLKGDLMTHNRRNFDRLYDLRERIAPPHLNVTTSSEEAEAFFALKIFHRMGIVDKRSWRSHLSGSIGRSVSQTEADARLKDLLESGKIIPIKVEGDQKGTSFVLSEDLPLLETLHSDNIPETWQPLENTNYEEALFLAPLEICSTRGRSLPLFDFDYIWEVYKPQEKRRWGYYTLPILYGSALIGRIDTRLERTTHTLEVKGFWLESGITVDHALENALAAAFHRFLSFIHAERLDPGVALPDKLQKEILRLAS